MYEVVGIDDGVVVGIYQLLMIDIRHIHALALRREYFERFGGIAIILRAVAGIGVDTDEYLILVARQNLLLQAVEKDSVVLAVSLWIELLELVLVVLLLYMERRGTPVASSPNNIHSISR